MSERLAWITQFLSAPRMGSKAQAFFVKRLSFLVRSGMPIPECLALLGGEAGNKRIQKAYSTLQIEIESGKPLSESFNRFPGLMSPFGIAVIRIGELSGTLSENLSYLAGELRKKSELRAKVIGAFIYPALITVATITLTIGLILFIFPKILPVFSGLNVPLPLSTRIVLALEVFVHEWGFVTLIVLGFVTTAAWIALKKSIAVRTYAEQAMLRIPLAGNMIRAYCISNIARVLSLLLASGMTLGEALAGTAEATGNLLYQAELRRLREHVEVGGDLAGYLKSRSSLFPIAVSQMILVGQSSGTLIETLTYISEFYENEVEELTKRLSHLAEPVLMIMMGGIVGFVAVSMITPIYEITQHLHAT